MNTILPQTNPIIQIRMAKPRALKSFCGTVALKYHVEAIDVE
jgi:hypothetical protein